MDEVGFGRFEGYVCHCGCEENGAYGVAFDFVLPSYWKVVLKILTGKSGTVFLRVLSPSLDKGFCQFEVAFFAGCAVEPDQRQLYLGVAGETGIVLLNEIPIGLVGGFSGDIEERCFAGCVVVCDGSFVEMACDVSIVLMVEICPGCEVVEQDVSVDIAVGALGGGEEGDDLVELFFEFGVGFDGEGICYCFDELV